jgi:hypothetical protein
LRITRAWAVNLSVNTFYIQQGRRKRGGGGGGGGDLSPPQ